MVLSLPPGDQLHSSLGEEAAEVDITGAKAIIWGLNERKAERQPLETNNRAVRVPGQNAFLTFFPAWLKSLLKCIKRCVIFSICNGEIFEKTHFIWSRTAWWDWESGSRPNAPTGSSCTVAAAGGFVWINKPEDAFSGDGFSFSRFLSPLITFLTSRPCHWTAKIRDAAAVPQLVPTRPLKTLLWLDYTVITNAPWVCLPSDVLPQNLGNSNEWILSSRLNLVLCSASQSLFFFFFFGLFL